MLTDPTKVTLTLDPTHRMIAGIATHGYTPFECPLISHIDGNLWQGGCVGGMHLPFELVHLVSLYPWEQYRVRHDLRSSLSVRMYDSEGQGFEQVDAIARWVALCLDDGPTLVHCQAGLNRSSLVAARALMLRGRSADEAIGLLRERRSPACLCNPTFERWLREQEVAA